MVPLNITGYMQAQRYNSLEQFISMNQKWCSEGFLRSRQLCGISNNLCEFNFIHCACLPWKWLSDSGLQGDVSSVYAKAEDRLKYCLCLFYRVLTALRFGCPEFLLLMKEISSV